jgi:hypothetical protein
MAPTTAFAPSPAGIVFTRPRIEIAPKRICLPSDVRFDKVDRNLWISVEVPNHMLTSMHFQNFKSWPPRCGIDGYRRGEGYSLGRDLHPPPDKNRGDNANSNASDGPRPPMRRPLPPPPLRAEAACDGMQWRTSNSPPSKFIRGRLSSISWHDRWPVARYAAGGEVDAGEEDCKKIQFLPQSDALPRCGRI